MLDISSINSLVIALQCVYGDIVHAPTYTCVPYAGMCENVSASENVISDDSENDEDYVDKIILLIFLQVFAFSDCRWLAIYSIRLFINL